MSCAAWHSVGIDFVVYKPQHGPICGSELLPLHLINKKQHGQKGLSVLLLKHGQIIKVTSIVTKFAPAYSKNTHIWKQ